MLDRSGSVGEENFESAIEFLQNVVSFFTIGSDSTQARQTYISLALIKDCTILLSIGSV